MGAMKRDPSRPKAADIPDVVALRCCAQMNEGTAWVPPLSLADFPPKVIEAKFDKLRARGLLDAKDRLTTAGRAFLAGVEEK